MLSVGNPSVLPPHYRCTLDALSMAGVSLPVAMPNLPSVLPLVNEVPSPTPGDIFSSSRVTMDASGRNKNEISAQGNDQGSNSGRSTPSDLPQNKLFVGGLSWQTSVEKLREYFGQYGTILDVQVLKDPLTQRSRGFGFITFAEAGSVDRVLQVPNHSLDGKKIDPKHATPKNKGKTATASRTKKVFVGGVSQDTSADEVKAYFSQFGRVDEAVMLMDQQTKRHRGFGFVTFESEDVVDRVCEIHYHTIKSKKVECKKAQPKEAILQSTASAILAAKRSVLLGGLGVGMPQLGPVVGVSAAQQLAAAQAAQVQAAVAAQAQSAAAAAGYGKLLAAYPALASYRYSPYSVPVSSTGPAAAPAAATLPPQGTATLATAPYQGYSLANVDMSSFQGVDWNSIYGVGMYV